MSAEQLKLLLDQLSERWRQQDALGAAALFTETARYLEPPAHELRGRATLANFFQSFFALNDAIEFSFSRILIGEDEAAAEWTFGYTRRTDGRRVRLAGIAFIDTAAGLINVWRSFSGRLAS